jgi:hypothetical protein
VVIALRLSATGATCHAFWFCKARGDDTIAPMSAEDETVGLSPGEAYELAREVRRELTSQIPSQDRDALIRRFGMIRDSPMENWIDIFLGGDEGNLIARRAALFRGCVVA